MKVAIIGAGFAGLATAYFLTQCKGISVTVFEKSKVGGGASGIAGGLLHPYPGLMARRSQRAEEALLISKLLLRVAQAHTSKMVCSQEGILRQSLCDEQHQRLVAHCDEYGDIKHLKNNLFLIQSGITVLCANYLEGLACAVEGSGGVICIKEVGSIEELSDFEHIVIAAGYGIRGFAQCASLDVGFLKGQVLRIKGSPLVEKSFISKGYIAHVGTEHYFDIGSTYERDFTDSRPNLARAKELLADKLKPYDDREILACKSGVRICPHGHYLPITGQLAPRVIVFTGLGSRGLLYHGLFGREVANQIAKKGPIA